MLPPRAASHPPCDPFPGASLSGGFSGSGLGQSHRVRTIPPQGLGCELQLCICLRVRRPCLPPHRAPVSGLADAPCLFLPFLCQRFALSVADTDGINADVGISLAPFLRSCSCSGKPAEHGDLCHFVTGNCSVPRPASLSRLSLCFSRLAPTERHPFLHCGPLDADTATLPPRSPLVLLLHLLRPACLRVSLVFPTRMCLAVLSACASLQVPPRGQRRQSGLAALWVTFLFCYRMFTPWRRGTGSRCPGAGGTGTPASGRRGPMETAAASRKGLCWPRPGGIPDERQEFGLCPSLYTSIAKAGLILEFAVLSFSCKKSRYL